MSDLNESLARGLAQSAAGETVELDEYTVKHPSVFVKLTGEDGNAFSILNRVNVALREAGVPKSERDAFMDEAMSGDYDNLLRTVMSWVVVE